MIPSWIVITGSGAIAASLLLSRIARFREEKRALGSIRESAPPISREERDESLQDIREDARGLMVVLGIFVGMGDVSFTGLLIITILQYPPPNAVLFWGALCAAVVLPSVYSFGWAGFVIWSRYYIRREQVMRRRLSD